jgi:hypothetical protein
MTQIAGFAAICPDIGNFRRGLANRSVTADAPTP